MEEGINLGTIEIPLIKGETGAAGKIVSISITMLSSTATAYANNTGTEEQAQIVLGIPRGVSITNAEVVSDELILHLDNGTDVNCGNVKGTGISNVTIDENYNFVVEMTDGSTTIAGSLSDMINQILTDYATKTWTNNAIADSEESTLAIVAGDVELTINPTTYVLTAKLENSSGQVISSSSIDLPLESMVVSGRYDSATKKVILTLQNGSTVEFSVADLIDGLVSTTDLETTLEDYVKNTDYATSSKGGVVKVNSQYGVAMLDNETLRGVTADYTTYQARSSNFIISKGTLENVLNARIGDINTMLDTINGEVI